MAMVIITTVMRVKNKDTMYISLFFNMTILGVNFLVPLLIIPIISKYYSFTDLNEYLFFQSLLALISMISDWGFSTTGVKELASKVNKKDKLDCLFEIVQFRVFIFIILFFSVFIILSLFRHESNLNMGSLILLSALSFSISPIFYLQYEDKMKCYSIFNLISKITFIFTVYYVSYNQYQFEYIGTLFFICYTIVPFVFLSYIFYQNKRYISYVTIKRTLAIGKNNTGFLIASVCSSSYRIFPVMIAGFFFPLSIEFSAYAIVDRIIRGLSSLIQPISQTMLPIILKKGSSVKIFLSYIFLGISMSIFIFLFGAYIIEFMARDDDVLIIGREYINILAIIPFFVCVSNYFGNQRLIVEGYISELNLTLRVISLFSLVYFIAIYILKLKFVNFMYVSIFSELFVLLGFVYACATKRISVI